METAQHALQSALPARRMFSFPHDPKAARRIAAGIGQRQSAAIPSRQQGRRKRILQGALCLLKSGSYLPFPSLPPLAKAAVAPAQMQVSCLPGFQRPAYLHPQPVSVLPELRAIARGTPCCKKCVLPWYPAATYLPANASTVRKGRAASRQAPLPCARLLTGLAPRCFPHCGRSAPPHRQPLSAPHLNLESIAKRTPCFNRVFFLGIRQLPIFPGRRQPSIVGV